MLVHFYGLDEDARDVTLATLRLEGGKIKGEGHRQLVENVLAEPVLEKGVGRPIRPDDDPKGFLANLHFQYRGAYLRAGPAEGGARPLAESREPLRILIEAVVHAPHGYTHENPLILNGKPFLGGEFIPNEDLAAATPQELQAAGISPDVQKSLTQGGQKKSGGTEKPAEQQAPKSVPTMNADELHAHVGQLRQEKDRLFLATRADASAGARSAFLEMADRHDEAESALQKLLSSPGAGQEQSGGRAEGPVGTTGEPGLPAGGAGGGPGGPDRPGGGGVPGKPQTGSGGVAPAAGGPGGQEAGRAGPAAGEPDGGKAAGRVPARREVVRRRVGQYYRFFKKKGMHKVADFMAEMWKHVKEAGTEESLKALGDLRGVSGQKNVAYEGGTYDERTFTNRYLKRYGVSGTHLEGIPPISSEMVFVSSVTPKNRGEYKLGPKDFAPRDPTLPDKLAEAQNLPGLESSEDLGVVTGQEKGTPVTHLDKKVTDALDKKYGKGGWIVKSYGADAYDGFGIFFAERAAKVKESSRNAIRDAVRNLHGHGMKLYRDEAGAIAGVETQSGRHPFDSKSYDENVKGEARRWAGKAHLASRNEFGAALPTTPEDELGKFGMRLRKGPDGRAVGIEKYDDPGQFAAFGSKEYREFSKERSFIAHWADRAKDANDYYAETGTKPEAPKFMAQPAFRALGMSAEDRAEGQTWGAATEGRVHLMTRNGRAEPVPHATWYKKASLPVVFENDDTRAMAKAAADAINSLPESERQGQMYAPDVQKTDQGWKVIEANPEAEGGGSAWLDVDPFTIDAVASHVVGEDPYHVAFTQRLLTEKKKGGQPQTIPSP